MIKIVMWLIVDFVFVFIGSRWFELFYDVYIIGKKLWIKNKIINCMLLLNESVI